MPALEVAKNYQKSGLRGLYWNYLTTQITDNQVNTEY
jgi:hypothetical protein